MLVYDLTDRQSFEDLAFFHRRFISLTRAWRDPDAPALPIVVVANKCDLPRSQWVVTRQEAKEWCALHASSISTKAGAGWVRSGSGAGAALLRQFGLESPAVSSSSRFVLHFFCLLYCFVCSLFFSCCLEQLGRRRPLAGQVAIVAPRRRRRLATSATEEG